MHPNILLLVVAVIAYLIPLAPAFAQPRIHLSQDSFEFDLIDEELFGQRLRAFTFVINQGDEALEWRLEIEFNQFPEGAPPPEDWFLLDDSAGVLQPGEIAMVTFGVAINGLPGGMYSIDLHFLSNDPNNQEADVVIIFDISGIPAFYPIPPQIDFNTVFSDMRPGESYTLPIRWFNNGTDDLEIFDYLIDSDNFQVDVDLEEAVIAQGGFLPGTVTFQAGDTGAYQAELLVESNAPPPPEVGVWVIPITAVITANEVRGRLDNPFPEHLVITSVNPNPFNSSTTITYDIARPGFIRLGVYDIGGRLVGTVKEGYTEAGRYSTVWNGEGAASGNYLLKLEGVDSQSVMPIGLMK